MTAAADVVITVAAKDNGSRKSRTAGGIIIEYGSSPAVHNFERELYLFWCTLIMTDDVLFFSE